MKGKKICDLTWIASCSTLVDDSTAALQATFLLLLAKSEFSGYSIPGIFIHPAAEFKLQTNSEYIQLTKPKIKLNRTHKKNCRPCLAALETKERGKRFQLKS